MIIEVDAFKKLIPDYNPEKSEDFHTQSAKLADKAFEAALRERKFTKIVFLAGGAASGKTEFASLYLQDEDILVYDGTMQNTAGFEIKLKKIRKLQPDTPVEVILVLPENIEEAYRAFLGRERKMNDSTFERTHVNARKSAASIMQTQVNVSVRLSFSEITSVIESRPTFTDFDPIPDIVANAKKLLNSAKDLEIFIPKMIINVKM
jgi:hypothetical protein